MQTECEHGFFAVAVAVGCIFPVFLIKYDMSINVFLISEKLL